VEEAQMSSAEIDSYLAGLAEPKRSTLEEMRRRILEVLPTAEQTISYAVPAFKVDGKTVAGLAAFTHHLSYLPHSGSVLGSLRDQTTGYTQTRSALHFAVDEPLPRPLIRELLAVKMAEVGLGPS
jgi:uncharacterized protein YdhG (YjbR/CyaY superfamily)